MFVELAHNVSRRLTSSRIHSISLISRHPPFYSSVGAMRNFSAEGSTREPSQEDGTKQNLEEVMEKALRDELKATAVRVRDISGGCGAMFNVEVESPHFEGKRLVQQHRMVNEVLKSYIKDMHGLTVTTKKPE